MDWLEIYMTYQESRKEIKNVSLKKKKKCRLFTDTMYSNSGLYKRFDLPGFISLNVYKKTVIH